jgi:hypothetical protein
LIFDLKAADGHLVYGPYLWFPAGHYEATFDLTLTHVAPAPTAKLVIEIVDNTDKYLAQRDLFPLSPAPESKLQIVLDGSELFLEFRVFAKGFAGGELRFGGIKLYRHGSPQERHDREGAVSPRPERAVDQTRTIASTAPSNENVALYVMSYNFPGQFRLWLESVERANPELLASPARFLLDNSSDLDTRAGYDELSERYGFTVLRHGNLGITGGRVFCAKHFDALPQLGAILVRR